jgi:hypothetical protein
MRRRNTNPSSAAGAPSPYARSLRTFHAPLFVWKNTEDAQQTQRQGATYIRGLPERSYTGTVLCKVNLCPKHAMKGMTSCDVMLK